MPEQTNKTTNLESTKAELEQAYENERQHLQELEKDIALMERLYATKIARAESLQRLQTISEQYEKLCALNNSKE